MMWMGIDGGGSTLRVVIVDDDIQVQASIEGEAVNPSSVGHDIAAERIRTGMIAAMQAAGVSEIAGIGIGVAGAAADHSEIWLRAVVASVLPNTPLTPSSDIEIALVGARGRLDGLVLLAGTGSVAYGVNTQGQKLRAGGWGYLLGDEGSGYWIGLQALHTVTHVADHRLKTQTHLPEQTLAAIGISTPLEVIRWMYHEAKPTDVAKLASVVLSLAEEDDAIANDIITEAASHLAQLAEHLCKELGLSHEAIVFAGGLLTSENALSHEVVQALDLNTLPESCYSPVVGAALLVKLIEENR